MERPDQAPAATLAVRTPQRGHFGKHVHCLDMLNLFFCRVATEVSLKQWLKMPTWFICSTYCCRMM
jgi:hypothetical protein